MMHLTAHAIEQGREELCDKPGSPVEPRYDGDFTHNTGRLKNLSAPDDILFALSLVIPTAIGFYQAWRSGLKMSLDEYVMGQRRMGSIPVGCSLTASFMSAVTMLGAPAEVYEHNTMYFWVCLSFLGVGALAAHVYIPVFFQLKLNTAYQYLEMRFSRPVRSAGACMFILQMIMYMSVVLYAPSVAFSEVTGLHMWGSIVSIGLVCTLYVTLGGIKAVLWTDTFQLMVMYVSTVTILGQAAATVGISDLWESAKRTNRIHILDFRVNPTLRHSAWSLLFGGGFLFLSTYAVDQVQVHRCLTCRTLREAKIAIWISIPGRMIFLAMSLLVGLYMGAFYENCDPLKAELVSDDNHMTPFFMQDILSHSNGLCGLYMAGVFSATLSSVSSALNSISNVLFEDFIVVYLKTGLRQDKQRLYMQITSIIFGMTSLEVTFLASQWGEILEAGNTVCAVIGGPLLGVFSLGMFFPWANEKGALVGLIMAVFITSLVARLPHDPDYEKAIKCVSNCNVTAFAEFQTVQNMRNYQKLEQPWAHGLSYMWLSCLACFSCIIIGLIVSYATGFQKPKDLDARLIVPLMDEVFPFYHLSESTRKLYRFGIEHEGKFDIKPVSNDVSLERTKTLSYLSNDVISLGSRSTVTIPRTTLRAPQLSYVETEV